MVCFRCVIVNTMHKGDNKDMMMIIIIIIIMEQALIMENLIGNKKDF